MNSKAAIMGLIFFICSCSSNPEQIPSHSKPEIQTAVSDAEMKEVYTLISEYRYEEAAELTQEFLEARPNMDNALLWHLDGFAHKGLFSETRDKKSRSIAISSFKKTMELDSTHKLSEQAAPALNYLSISLYNDAVDIIVEADPGTIHLADEYFSKYKSSAVFLDPQLDFTSKEIEFLLAMSTAYRKIYEKTESNKQPFKSKQEDYLNKVLILDPNNETAQYSLYVLQHNERLKNPK